MQPKTKYILYLTLSIAGVVLLFGIRSMIINGPAVAVTSAKAASTSHANSNRAKLTKLVKTRKSSASHKTAVTTATLVAWHGPSEPNHPYPNVQNYPNLRIDVSVAKQRVYLKAGDKLLYTMLATTGKPGANATPKGDFVIQPERGLHFYNASLNEGANYWVSFKDHGVYLFHSVPVDASDHYIASKAALLGKKSDSHGCVRLSISDAKWMYENIPVNTPVHIQ
ncbi:L,D-transpeptidase [Lactiplantibacillus paraplantarum]|uniref:L,D-transpeptidase n=1 Tax=Lactiplantibacillus paraplantarum TaxID=60520 RepID=UPI0021A41AE2|nr:L,D-transpeptidase [Lactiplantibacillus paraplantarum]MCT4456213.1 L,D-transpeptidase [Lactiplantibacillus paraplantarum]